MVDSGIGLNAKDGQEAICGSSSVGLGLRGSGWPVSRLVERGGNDLALLGIRLDALSLASSFVPAARNRRQQSIASKHCLKLSGIRAIRVILPEISTLLL